MKKPVRAINAESLEKLKIPVDINSMDVRAPKGDALATGFIYRDIPADGVFVSVGKLFGQRAYQAKVTSDVGLSIELRISGHSRSQELSGKRRKTSLSASDLLVTGLKRRTEWLVASDNQKAFETVSINFTEPFLRASAAQSKAVSAWGISLLESEAIWCVKQNSDLMRLASQLAAAAEMQDERKNFLQLSIALRVLSTTWWLKTKSYEKV